MNKNWKENHILCTTCLKISVPALPLPLPSPFPQKERKKEEKIVWQMKLSRLILFHLLYVNAEITNEKETINSCFRVYCSSVATSNWSENVICVHYCSSHCWKYPISPEHLHTPTNYLLPNFAFWFLLLAHLLIFQLFQLFDLQPPLPPSSPS